MPIEKDIKSITKQIYRLESLRKDVVPYLEPKDDEVADDIMYHLDEAIILLNYLREIQDT